MVETKRYTVSEPYLQSNCELGEAPFWEEKINTLRFFDIKEKKLHSVDLNEGPTSHEIKELDISIGTSADVEHSDVEIAFGGKHGFGIYNRNTGAWRYLKKFWDGEHDAAAREERMRSNDGAVDSHGRFWVGAMNDFGREPTNEGILFRLDPDLSLHRMVEGVTIPNGIAWSKDDKTFYIADSPTKCVYAYDFHAESGEISNRRVFFKVEDPAGVPDGHVVDEDNHLWQAIYGSGKVVRLSPEGETLYITTAAEEDPDTYPESTKMQGSVFRCHVGVQGLRPNAFQWKSEI